MYTRYLAGIMTSVSILSPYVIALPLIFIEWLMGVGIYTFLVGDI
ncbi:hypothetical protein P186_0233 [Pyrobaculum ferrireducens]|uniref:Uncharacterized protein n=1 Tax=Pyrobaculum ferrireducens TaxID=1104324 RepID=G7VF79_9CREN|nr:hypothetical protein P186_0233 [Pyrobaculum ferrireducens]